MESCGCDPFFAPTLQRMLAMKLDRACRNGQRVWAMAGMPKVVISFEYAARGPVVHQIGNGPMRRYSTLEYNKATQIEGS